MLTAADAATLRHLRKVAQALPTERTVLRFKPSTQKFEDIAAVQKPVNTTEYSGLKSGRRRHLGADVAAGGTATTSRHVTVQAALLPALRAP